MDKYDEDISSFYDGELDADSFEKSLSNSTNAGFKQKISMYGVISAAANLNNMNVLPIETLIQIGTESYGSLMDSLLRHLFC